jgi:type IV pilus modification protein PilV
VNTDWVVAGDRAGFTIVEVMIAMLVLSLGLLAMAGTATMVQRQMGSAQQQSLAAFAAEARFEQLRSVNCQSIAAGSATTRTVAEAWVKKDTTRAVIVTDSVRYTTRDGQRLQVYQTTVPCPANP